jgi:Na+-driven multidrug efflux pump
MKVGILLFPICKMIMEIINLITVLGCLFFGIERGSLK